MNLVVGRWNRWRAFGATLTLAYAIIKKKKKNISLCAVVGEIKTLFILLYFCISNLSKTKLIFIQ